MVSTLPNIARSGTSRLCATGSYSFDVTTAAGALKGIALIEGLTGEEGEDEFTFDGSASGNTNAKVTINGERLRDLTWPTSLQPNP